MIQGRGAHKPIWRGLTHRKPKSVRVTNTKSIMSWTTENVFKSNVYSLQNFSLYEHCHVILCSIHFMCTIVSYIVHHRTCVHIYVHNMYIWGFELAKVFITSPCPFIHSKLCIFQVYVIPRKITYKYYQHQCAATQASIHIQLYANYSIQNIGCEL